MKINKRTTIIVLTLLLFVVTAGFTAAMMIPNADELMAQSLETLEGVTNGHAIIEAELDVQDETAAGTVEVWGKLNAGPNGEPAARIEVLDASQPEMIGLTAVTDGTQFWLFDPNTNKVVTGQVAEMAAVLMQQMAAHEGDWQPEGELDLTELPQTPAEAVAKLLEYVTAERDGTEAVGSTNAYRLRLVPIPEQMPEELRAAGGYLNVWLRTSDQLPLGVEYAEGALGYGRITATMAEINTELDESIFTFSIPEGAEVIDALDLLAEMAEELEAAVPADFTPLTPTYLPAAARAAETSEIAGAVVQRFMLPDDLSFFVAQGVGMPIDAPAEATGSESVTVRGVTATLFANDEGTRTLLGWSEGEYTFIVGGDLSADEALAVAESLE